MTGAYSAQPVYLFGIPVDFKFVVMFAMIAVIRIAATIVSDIQSMFRLPGRSFTIDEWRCCWIAAGML